MTCILKSAASFIVLPEESLNLLVCFVVVAPGSLGSGILSVETSRKKVEWKRVERVVVTLTRQKFCSCND